VQIERKVPVFLVVISGAVLVPQYVALVRNEPFRSDGVLALGTALGAFAVMLGGGVALGQEHRVRQRLTLSLWTLIGVAMGVGTAVAAARTQRWGWRGLLGCTALLPPAAMAYVWRLAWREAHVPARSALPTLKPPGTGTAPVDAAAQPPGAGDPTKASSSPPMRRGEP